jgi:hypothetical protein
LKSNLQWDTGWKVELQKAYLSWNRKGGQKIWAFLYLMKFLTENKETLLPRSFLLRSPPNIP